MPTHLPIRSSGAWIALLSLPLLLSCAPREPVQEEAGASPDSVAALLAQIQLLTGAPVGIRWPNFSLHEADGDLKSATLTHRFRTHLDVRLGNDPATYHDKLRAEFAKATWDPSTIRGLLKEAIQNVGPGGAEAMRFVDALPFARGRSAAGGWPVYDVYTELSGDHARNGSPYMFTAVLELPLTQAQFTAAKTASTNPDRVKAATGIRTALKQARSNLTGSNINANTNEWEAMINGLVVW